MVAAQDAAGLPAGEGTITGTVLNATTGEPAADIEVMLGAFTSEDGTSTVPTMVGSATAMTDQSGAYVFEGVSVDPSVVYAASANYRSVPYSSDMIRFPEDGSTTSQSRDLTIYETTVEPTNLSISSRGLILAGVNSSLGEINIVDVTTLDLEGNEALAPDDQGRTVEFSIPRNASSVAPFPASGFEFGTPEVEGATLFASAPLKPGTTSATIGYTIPYTDDSLTIELQSAYAMDSLRIMVPLNTPGIEEGLTVNGAGLTFEGETQVGEQTYQLWTATDVGPGTRMRISYVSLPASQVSPNTLSKMQPTILAIVAALAAAAVVGFIVHRRRLYAVRPVALAPALAVSLDQRRDELTGQLRRLEFAHEDGSVDDGAYAEYRGVILEQLRLISRQQRGVGLDE